MEILGLKTISTFSLSHLIYIAGAVLIAILLNLILLKANKKVKRVFAFILSLLGLFAGVGLCVYGFLTIEGFDIFANLPLNLTGITFIVGVLFILSKSETMKSFAGYAGIFSGLYGLFLIPNGIMEGLSFELSTIIYFVPYIIAFVLGVSVFTFGLAKPTYKNMGKSVITVILLACFMHTLNVVLAVYEITNHANYFLTINHGRDLFSMMAYKYIPEKFVYLFAYLLLFIVLSSIISLFSLIKRKEKVETYAIDESLIQKAKEPQLLSVEEQITEKQGSLNEAVEENIEEATEQPKIETEVQVVEEVNEENQNLGDNWEDVIPEAVLEESKKEEIKAKEEIFIKDAVVEEIKEPKNKVLKSANGEKANPNIEFQANTVEEKAMVEDIKEPKQVVQPEIVKETAEPKLVEEKKQEVKGYSTYTVPEKPTQIQRKYSFADADRKRKNDPTLGVSKTRRTVSQSKDLLKDLRSRIDKLGK